MVQRLRLPPPMQKCGSIPRQLGIMPHGQKTKTSNGSNIVPNSIKSLKKRKKNPETGILKHYLYNKKQVLGDVFVAEGSGCSLLSLFYLLPFK